MHPMLPGANTSTFVAVLAAVILGYHWSQSASALASEESCSAGAKTGCRNLFAACTGDKECFRYLEDLGVAGRPIAELRTKLEMQQKIAAGSEAAADLSKCVLAADQKDLVPESRFGFTLNLDSHPEHIVISADPLIVQFDDFLSPEEVDYMKTIAEKTGYERSGVGGTPSNTVESMQRTSQHVFLTAYEEDPTIKALNKKIQNVLMTPTDEHFEHFQVVRYQGKREWYRQHSDLITDGIGTHGGFRIATFFIYLSDNQNGGGETAFDNGVKVLPKRGRAVLWFNALDADTESEVVPDSRVDHQAMPLNDVNEEKIGSNVWIHNKNFKKAWRENKVYTRLDQ